MSPIVEGNIILGRYQLLALLGEGVSGKVYRAWDQLREDTIAIKVLHQDVVFEWGGFDAIRPLLADICRLHHPAICSVFDFQLWDHTVLLFQEFVNGISLQTLLRSQQFPDGWQTDRSLLPRLGEIAAALSYASSICPHGHLHPGQVLLSRDGQVRVTDFGLAGLWRGDGLRNIAGFRRTHHYLAPEPHEPFTIKKAAVGDQFSFGMLWTDLAGAGCLDPETVLSNPPSSRAHPVMDKVRHRLTQADPNLRFPDWKDVTVFFGGEEGASGTRGRSGGQRMFRKGIQSWRMEVLVGVAVLAMVGLIYWAFQSSVQLERDAEKETEIRQRMSERRSLKSRVIEMAAHDAAWLGTALTVVGMSGPDVPERLYAQWQHHLERGSYEYANLVLEDLEKTLTEDQIRLRTAGDAMEVTIRWRNLRSQYDSLLQHRNPRPSIAYAVNTLHELYHHRENQFGRSPAITSMVDQLTLSLGQSRPLLPSGLDQPDSLGAPVEEVNRWLVQGLFDRVLQKATDGIRILEDLFRQWEKTLSHDAESLESAYHAYMNRHSMVVVPKPPYPDRKFSEAREAIASSKFEEGIIKLLKSVEVYEHWVRELRAIPEPGDGQFVNSIGMRFVPVEGLWVSVWETRICDFNVFVHETGTDGRRLWRENSDPVALTHPVVSLERYDARVFCDWLTERERLAGMISSNQAYRLPTDREWSVWLDLKDEAGATPEARSWRDEKQFPWGTEARRTPESGNYLTWPSASADNGYFGIMDPWLRTAPVGSFGANRYGLYDLGGNVWEMVSDHYNAVGDFPDRTLRGGSWRTMSLDFMRSNFRHAARANGKDIGFRVVLAPVRIVSPEASTTNHE